MLGRNSPTLPWKETNVKFGNETGFSKYIENLVGCNGWVRMINLQKTAHNCVDTWQNVLVTIYVYVFIDHEGSKYMKTIRKTNNRQETTNLRHVTNFNTFDTLINWRAKELHHSASNFFLISRIYGHRILLWNCLHQWREYQKL